MAEKILIVDDSVSMRQMAQIVLKQNGYEIVQAQDGKEALSTFNEEIDVVVTDLNMPNLDGIELIKSIRGGSVNTRVPIIMLTTESEETKKQEGKKAGATAWLTKPFNKDALLKVLHKVTGDVSF